MLELMLWLLAALTTITFVELLFRLPVFQTLSESKAIGSRALATIRSHNISDHWKEKALPRYAIRLFVSTILLALFLFASFAPFLILFAVSIIVQVPFSETILSLTGIVFVTILSSGFYLLRSGRGTIRL